jgi:hypothetical protein
VFAGGTRQGPVSLHEFINENYPVGLGTSYEVVENLHRSDLTELERSEQVAEWIRLADKPGHNAHVSLGGRGNEGGVSKASREERPVGNTAAAGLRKLQKAASKGNEKAQAVCTRKLRPGTQMVGLQCAGLFDIQLPNLGKLPRRLRDAVRATELKQSGLSARRRECRE